MPGVFVRNQRQALAGGTSGVSGSGIRQLAAGNADGILGRGAAVVLGQNHGPPRPAGRATVAMTAPRPGPEITVTEL